MTKGRIYLAGGIFGLDNRDAAYWRAVATARLEGVGFEIADPLARADYRGLDTTPGLEAEIVEGDLRELSKCHMVLASCLTPSWGTAMEIRQARSLALPVYAIVDLSRPVSPWLRYHAARMFSDVTDAVAKIITAGVPTSCYPAARDPPDHSRRTIEGSRELTVARAEVARMERTDPVNAEGRIQLKRCGVSFEMDHGRGLSSTRYCSRYRGHDGAHDAPR